MSKRKQNMTATHTRRRGSVGLITPVLVSGGLGRRKNLPSCQLHAVVTN
jgi:hypothetical protein